ncbi:MAG: hydratase, partial [Burkholderiales bacterium]|nr:hydratase [Burkholderiales bacterium]
LCVPTNWVPMPDQPTDQLVMANILAMGGAHSNALFVAAADRVGVERGQPFLGNSLIVSNVGWPIAGPASATDVQTLFADINLSDARRRRNLSDFNHILRDRRTDVYDEMLGTDTKPGWY